MDTLSMQAGYSQPAVVTGKPVVVGGSQGQQEATGRGVMAVAFATVARTAAEDGTTMRQAAYRIAVDKVARATQLRGIYP